MTPLFPQRKQIMKAYDQVTGEEITPKPPKRYLMLITWTGAEEDDWNRYWEKVTSREEVIRRVHSLRDDIEYDESYICSESAALCKTWHLYTFLRYCYEAGFWADELVHELGGYSFDDFESELLNDYEISKEELTAIYLEEVRS